MRDNDKAARTAANSLESIETWARRTCYAAIATAVLMGFVALVTGMIGFDYLRLKWYASNALHQMESANRVDRLTRPIPKVRFYPH